MSITFAATSNNVKPTASRQSSVNGVRSVIPRSKTFGSAFENVKGVPSIIQSSESAEMLRAAPFGLVSTIMEAYNHHHNLILRPDDIWQAILTQFSFYVNANADDLRDCFVDFQGKKTLVVEMPPGTLFSTDFGEFANRMVDEKIAANLKDPEVTTWLLPKFSTTKLEDRVAASVTIMSTLQAYFEYHCMICCGIPKVTLEGTPADWKLLRQKIDRLPRYDVKGKDQVMNKWHGLLAPVLDQFVNSVEGRPSLDFWDTVCSRTGGGSGPSYLSGWITVFACFKVNGSWQGYLSSNAGQRGNNGPRTPQKWPKIDTTDIPVASVSVPVLVDDNGTQYETQMLAGQFAHEVVASQDQTIVPDASLAVASLGQTVGPDASQLDTVRPRTDWCIAYIGMPAEKRKYKDGEVLPSKRSNA